jgi:signal recognition particle receptor subunit beta
VKAIILYWGAEGAGKSANLRTIHAKLRSDHRGELREVPTRLDPTENYEVLPIELGEVRGIRTELQIIAVPGSPEQAPTRMQLLDGVHGLVLVVDSQPDRVDANIAALEELRKSLSAYGRDLDSIPLVIQYNKHDLADPVALEDLFRKLEIPGAAVFETVATEGNGALRTLTTISKQVMRVLREKPAPETAPAVEPTAVEKPAATPSEPFDHATAPMDELVQQASLSSTQLMEQAILAEGEEAQSADSTARDTQVALDRPWSELEVSAGKPGGLRLGPDLRIVSVGDAHTVDLRAVRIPLVLGNDEGETVTLALTVSLDPLVDGEDP